MSGLIPQRLQFQAQVTLASQCRCGKSCARRSVFFCSPSCGGTSIRLLT